MLKVNDISKNFGSLKAVRNLSFSVEKGEVLGIVGQNGAGKSTTFKMILGYLQPDNGKVTINNRYVSEEILDRIGFLPEERGLYLDMTIQQQIEYFASLHGVTKKDSKERLAYWLEKLEVKGHKKTKIKDLSKGNQQKIQLICTLIHKPEFLILDEPFSGLDPINIDILLSVITELREEGVAIIFSSHNMQNVARISDKILMLVNGRAALYGNINDIRSMYESRKLYVEGISIDKINRTPGITKYSLDYPGYIIEFSSNLQVLNAINIYKKDIELSGYRIIIPTLDDIFKIVLKGEKNEKD